MENPLGKRSRRAGLELQLTAMVDIFSIMVIFLIKGTVFGASDLFIPEGVKLPESISKESAESAPQVAITDIDVSISVFPEKIELAAFRSLEATPKVAKLKVKLKEYVSKLPKDAKKSGVLLNVMADRRAPYQDVYDVVRVFRESGFETLLFIATGKAIADSATSPKAGGP